MTRGGEEGERSCGAADSRTGRRSCRHTGVLAKGRGIRPRHCRAAGWREFARDFSEAAGRRAVATGEPGDYLAKRGKNRRVGCVLEFFVHLYASRAAPRYHGAVSGFARGVARSWRERRAESFRTVAA